MSSAEAKEAPLLNMAQSLEEANTKLAASEARIKELNEYKKEVEANHAAKRVVHEAEWEHVKEFMDAIHERAEGSANPVPLETGEQLKETFLNPSAQFAGFHNWMVTAHRYFANSRSTMEKELQEKLANKSSAENTGVPFEKDSQRFQSAAATSEIPRAAKRPRDDTGEAVRPVERGTFQGSNLIEAIFAQV
jgi:hypothetical protein